MPNQFEVTVRSVEEVHTLPGIWSNESLRQLLISAEMDEIGQVDDAELLDIVIMALQDLGNQQAGELVLDSVFGDATDVLNRLYEEELEAGPFTDAAGMIWHFAEHDDEVGGEGAPETGLSRSFEVIAPRVWLEPLEKGMVFEASISAPW